MSDGMMFRVASAIAQCQGSEDWRIYISSARASLAAMREPTVGMLEAANHGLPDWAYLLDDWHAMIDHAIGELDRALVLEKLQAAAEVPRVT